MEKKLHKARPNDIRIGRAKKNFGQHFLKDGRVLSRIIQTAALTDQSVVLEIGPGKGALTKKLLETGATVIAVEKDYDLIPLLQEIFAQYIASKKLILVREDILKWIPNQKLLADQAYQVVANIPYNITGSLIEALLTSKAQPTSMTLLVQKEVADRITAKDKKGSILAWAVRYFGTPKSMFTVPKTAFRPPPKVTSAVIHISEIQKGVSGVSHDFFFKLLHAAFAHKRKQLQKNLKSAFSPAILQKVWSELALPEQIRAEDLSWEKWIALVKALFGKKT